MPTICSASPPASTLADLDAALDREVRGLAFWQDQKAAETAASSSMARMRFSSTSVAHQPNPQLRPDQPRAAGLGRPGILRPQRGRVQGLGVGEIKAYPIGAPPPGLDPDKPETDTRPKRFVKCVYFPRPWPTSVTTPLTASSLTRASK